MVLHKEFRSDAGEVPGWLDDDQLAGDRMFALSRLLWLPRTLAAAFGQARAEWGGDGFPAELSINSIGGVAGADGRIRPLPFLKRRLLQAWRKAWLVADLDKLPELPVVRAEGSWALEDDARALVALEVLRSKGVRTVRVRRSDRTDAAPRPVRIPLAGPKTIACPGTPCAAAVQRS
jgi:hypothetical protein